MHDRQSSVDRTVLANGLASRPATPLLPGPVAQALDLQRSAGNQAVARWLSRAPTSPTLARRVVITFGSLADSQDDEEDTREVRITNVIAERDATAVAVEDTFPGAKGQRAHATSNTVLTHALIRELQNRTWAEAWKVLQREFLFLKQLATRWYALNLTHPNAALHAGLVPSIDAELTKIDNQLQRGGFPITSDIWWTKNKATAAVAYFDHAPQPADGIDPSTHEIKPWRPKLTSQYVARLNDIADRWVRIRGQIPWTSIDTDSYVKGDMAGPDQVQNTINANDTAQPLPAGQLTAICASMLKTFDAFPPSLTQARPLEVIAALAARHVVEHLEYHDKIPNAWRGPIKTRFLRLWKARLEHDADTEDAKNEEEAASHGSGKKRAKKRVKVKDPARNTAAIRALLARWDEVTTAYDDAYTELAKALQAPVPQS